jgi:hypothetical protein
MENNLNNFHVVLETLWGKLNGQLKLCVLLDDRFLLNLEESCQPFGLQETEDTVWTFVAKNFIEVSCIESIDIVAIVWNVPDNF